MRKRLWEAKLNPAPIGKRYPLLHPKPELSQRRPGFNH